MLHGKQNGAPQPHGAARIVGNGAACAPMNIPGKMAPLPGRFTKGDVMVEEANRAVTTNTGLRGIFITLPFDEGISFESSTELLNWLKEEKNKFKIFISVNGNDVIGKNVANSYSNDVTIMINKYFKWYEVLLALAIEMNELQEIAGKSIIKVSFEEKVNNFIHTCAEFSDDGFFPMQSSVGMTAMAMSRVQANLQKNDLHELPDLPQSIAWLYAMMVHRKQQLKQEKSATDVKLSVEAGRDQLTALQKDIEEAQANVVRYKDELETFQKNALKSAALKSPANSLGKLERGHLVAAGGWFLLAAVITVAWATFIIKYYFPIVVAPLLAAKGWLPYETGAMVLTSVILNGIVLTSVIILLRLAIARINFSVAAGERKAMAMAFRALLLQHAISDDQQMLFLQNIVGSKLPDYVNCNDIRLPADELAKIVQAASNVKKDAF